MKDNPDNLAPDKGTPVQEPTPMREPTPVREPTLVRESTPVRESTLVREPTLVRESLLAPRRRRAYILIVVLGLTAVVTTLGWAFLDANSTVMSEGVNWTAAVRAQYLAESGAALGRHYLMYPPTTVACGGYWTGASNIAVDATADYTNVAVVQSTTDLYQFTITAVGVAHNPDGGISGKHTVTAQVLRPVDGKWHFCQAFIATEGMTFPSTVRVTGGLHVNGWMYSECWCQGNVSASDTVDWHGTGPPASITSNVPARQVPTGTIIKYKNYSLNGTNYSATTWSNPTMTSTDATNLNAQDWSTTNPGRIIYRNGDLKVKANVHLNGTLLVTGNLQFEGLNIQVTAVQDFPAAVIGGYIWFTNHYDTASFVGSVICLFGVWDNGRIVNLTITGTFIMGYGFSMGGTTDQLRFNWDANRSQFWDFENGTGISYPMTVLSWQDS